MKKNTASTTKTSELSDQGFACLRAAVTLARAAQIPRIAMLRRALAADGWSDLVITEALYHWASYEKRKP